MKSLSELAAIYEKWATANEATAEEILLRLESLPVDIQQRQRWRASHGEGRSLGTENTS